MSPSFKKASVLGAVFKRSSYHSPSAAANLNGNAEILSSVTLFESGAISPQDSKA